MARFGVYRLRTGGLVLDIQANALEQLNTRVVIPLEPISRFPKPIARLNPMVDLFGDRYVLNTHFIGTVSDRDCVRAIADLSALRDQITAALDLLFQGF